MIRNRSRRPARARMERRGHHREGAGKGTGAMKIGFPTRFLSLLIPGAVAVSLAGSKFGPTVDPFAGLENPPGAIPAAGTVSQLASLRVPTLPAADTISFTDDVLPIFQQRCAQCHGGADENGQVRLEAGLNLLEYEKVMAGSEFGTVVEAGNAEDSFLLEMIVEGDMPEEGDPVPEDEIRIIRAWIEAGAPNN